LAFAPFVLLWLGGAALAAEYRIGRGDTVEITVLGYPDLSRKVTVNTAGEVALPYVGNLTVSGNTLDEVRATLKKAYAEKGVVRGAEIVVGIFEYAPVYVNGDVSKPGSYGFRPGMTVRHAVALASGYAMRPEGLTAADIWGQHRAALLDVLKAQARVIRLQAELDGEERVDFAQLRAPPSDRTLMDRIIELEVRQFDSRRKDRRRELDHLKEMAMLAQRQVASLEEQQEQEKATLKSLTADYERVNKAFKSGVLPAARLTEALQGVALVKSRAATNLSQIVETRRLQADFERRAQRFDDAERLKLLSEVQDALITAEVARSRLRVAREKMNRGGVRGFGNVANVEIRIFRQGGQGAAADENTALQSGDVVEVRLPYEDEPMAERPVGRAQSPE
jgi:polysaccharide export outer membrane protein